MAKIKVSKFVKTANGIVPLGEDGRQIGAKTLLQSGNIEFNSQEGVLSLLNTKSGKTVYYNGVALLKAEKYTKDISKEIKSVKKPLKAEPAGDSGAGSAKAGKIRTTSAPYTLVRVHKNKTDKGVLKDYKYILSEKSSGKEVELLRGDVEKFFENKNWDGKDRSKRLLGGSGALVDGLIENYYAKDDTWHLRVNKNAEVVIDEKKSGSGNKPATYTMTDVWARTSVTDKGKHKLEKYAYGLTNDDTKQSDVYTRDELFNLFLNKTGTGDSLYDSKRLNNATLQYYKSAAGAESWRVRVQEAKVNWHVDEVGATAVNAVRYMCARVYCVQVPNANGSTSNQYVEFEVVPLAESDIEGLKAGTYTADELFSSSSMVLTGADVVALAEKPGAKSYPFYDSLKFDNLYIKNVYGKDDQDRQAEIVVYKEDEMPKRSLTQYVPEVVMLDYETWKKSHQSHVDKIEKFIKAKEDRADSTLIDWDAVLKQPIAFEDIKCTNISLPVFWDMRNACKYRFNTLPLTSDDVTEVPVMYDISWVSDTTYMVSEARTKGSMRSNTARKFTLVGEVPSGSAEELGSYFVKFISCITNELEKRLVLIAGIRDNAGDKQRFVITCTDSVTQKKIVNNQTVYYVPVVWKETFEAVVKAENEYQAKKLADNRLDKIVNMPAKEYRKKTGDYEVREIAQGYRKSAEIVPSALYQRLDKENEAEEESFKDRGSVTHEGTGVVLTQLRTHKELKTYKCIVEVTMYTFVPVTAESEEEAFGVKLQEAIKAGVIDSCEARSLAGAIDVKSCTLVGEGAGIAESVSGGQRELEAWNGLDTDEIPLDYDGEVMGENGDGSLGASASVGTSLEESPNYLDIIEWMAQTDKFSFDLLNDSQEILLGANKEHKLTVAQFKYAFDMKDLDPYITATDGRAYELWYKATSILDKNGVLYMHMQDALGVDSKAMSGVRVALQYLDVFKVSVNFVGDYVLNYTMDGNFNLTAEIGVDELKCSTLKVEGTGGGVLDLQKEYVYEYLHKKLMELQLDLGSGSDNLGFDDLGHGLAEYIDVRVNMSPNTIYKPKTQYNKTLYDYLSKDMILFYHKNEGEERTLYCINKKKVTLADLLNNIRFKKGYKNLRTVQITDESIITGQAMYMELLKNGIDQEGRIRVLSAGQVKSVLEGTDTRALLADLDGTKGGIDIVKLLGHNKFGDFVLNISNVLAYNKVNLGDGVEVSSEEFEKAVGLGSDALYAYIDRIADIIDTDSDLFMKNVIYICSSIMNQAVWDDVREAALRNEDLRQAISMFVNDSCWSVVYGNKKVVSGRSTYAIGKGQLGITVKNRDLYNCITKENKTLDDMIMDALSYADKDTANGKAFREAYKVLVNAINLAYIKRLNTYKNVHVITETNQEYKAEAVNSLFIAPSFFFELVNEGHKPVFCAIKVRKMSPSLWCENVKCNDEIKELLELIPDSDIISVGKDSVYSSHDFSLPVEDESNKILEDKVVSSITTFKLTESETINSEVNILNDLSVVKFRSMAHVKDDALEVLDSAAKEDFISLDNTYGLSVDTELEGYVSLRKEAVTQIAVYSFDYTETIDTKGYSIIVKVTAFDTNGLNSSKSSGKSSSNKLKQQLIDYTSEFMDSLINYFMDMHSELKSRADEASKSGVSGTSFVSEEPAEFSINEGSVVKYDEAGNPVQYLKPYLDFALKGAGGYTSLHITDETSLLSAEQILNILMTAGMDKLFEDRLGTSYVVQFSGNDSLMITRTAEVYEGKKATYKVVVVPAGAHASVAVESLKSLRYNNFADFLKECDAQVSDALLAASDYSTKADTALNWDSLEELGTLEDLGAAGEGETSEPVDQADIDDAMAQFNDEGSTSQPVDQVDIDDAMFQFNLGEDEPAEDTDEDEFMALFNSMETVDVASNEAQISMSLDGPDIADAAALFDGAIELSEDTDEDDVLNDSFVKMMNVLFKHFAKNTKHTYSLDLSGTEIVFNDNGVQHTGKAAVTEIRNLGVQYTCKMYPYFDRILSKLEDNNGSSDISVAGLDIMGLQEYYDKYGDSFINKTCNIYQRVSEETEKEIEKSLSDVGIVKSNFGFLSGVDRK